MKNLKISLILFSIVALCFGCARNTTTTDENNRDEHPVDHHQQDTGNRYNQEQMDPDSIKNRNMNTDSVRRHK